MPPAAVDRRWPWGVAGASALLAVAGAPLAVANAAHSGIERVYVLDAIAGALVPVAGALILARSPRHRIGWVLLSVAGLSISFFLAEWSRFGRATVPGSLPATDWAGWISEITWVPILGLITLLPLWFPTGRVPSRRWLPLQVGVLAVYGALLVACLLHPVTADGIPSPLTAGLPDWTADLRPVTTTVLVFSSLGCLAALVARYVHAGPEDRRRLRWLPLAVGVAVLTMFLPGLPVVVADVLTGVALALVAGAVTAAVVQGLPGVDVLVNRSLVLALASVGCYALYVVAVAAVGGLLPTAAGFAGVAAVALAFAPARALAARGVDRVLRGRPADPLAALATVGERLDAAGDPGLGTALDGVAEVLGSAHVGVLDRDGAVVASSGSPRPEVVDELPMTVRGRPLGTLVVAPRTGGEQPGDRELRTALARSLAGARHAATLAADLQLTRERLVLAQEEERRRLHRDLHDGVGPVLSHAVLGLDGVRADLAPASAPGLAAVKTSLQEALADLRRVVQGLRPPALDDLGLAGALAKHVDLVAAVEVTLTVDALPPDLPAAVEVAAYRIATEALANVARHAGAGHATLAVRGHAGELVVTVTDDGVGLPASPAGGVGLSSIRDRAEELGGSLHLAGAEDGGTVVTARLPVHR